MYPPYQHKDIVYGVFCPTTGRIMIVGETDLCLSIRLQNYQNKARAGHGSPSHTWRYNELCAGRRPDIRPILFQSEKIAIEHYGLDNLLNERVGGGGRKTPIDYASIDPLLGTMSDMALARQAGVSATTIYRRRQKLGIPTYRRAA